MSRVVTLPDGTRVNNVPNEVTDEELYQKYLDRQLRKTQETQQPIEDPEVDLEEEEEEDVGVGVDLLRGITQYGRAGVRLASDILPTPEGFTKKEFVDASTRQFVNTITDVLPGLDSEDIITPEGKVKERGLSGTAVEVAPYIVGSVAMSGSKLLANTPRIVKGVLSGVTVDQLLYTGDNSLANMLSEEELFEAEGMAKDLVDFLTIEEDDSVLEERAKLLAEGVVLGLGAEAVVGGLTLAAKAKKLFNKKPSNLNREEETEVVLDYLRDARQTTKLRSQEPEIVFSETPEGVAQVAQQNSSKIKRFTQQIFTSRGYWTPQAFNAFNDAQYAQRQIVKQAENISNRLQQSLRNLSDETATETATKSVQKALTEDLGFEVTTKPARIKYVTEKYGVTEEIAEEILNARSLIDSLSSSLVNSNIPNKELKSIIAGNSGEYLRRSYRLFEDSGYKPSESVVRQAEDYLASTQLKRGKSHEEAYSFARGKVNEILAKGDRTAAEDYYSTVRRVNKEILGGKKEIPAELRALMGEIEEPAENIVLTVAKLAKLTENNKFYNNLYSLGANKYIFNQSTDQYAVKITGTNSVLDGKFTTPEMLTALKQKESQIIDFSGSTFFRNLSALKGTSQKMKTIYSHVTHLRNITGGAQFGIANGINPFNKGSSTVKSLSNSILNGTDEELDAMYEKYLRLGIINTNVRVNEFRALLETGFEAEPDSLVAKLGQKVKGYGFIEKGDKLATEAYMAVDDFYKVNAFEYELGVLKRAMPDESIDVLESEAARIVQNTFPNYDRVPKGIKTLRYLPVGNFVAFPTEIWRTSTHIIKQASKEITSGNAELASRGRQRLAGFTAMIAAPSFVASEAAQYAGFNEDEAEAIQTLTKTPWSDAPKNVVRFGDKLYVNDTQFIDSYSPLKEPFMAAQDRIESGQLKGEALEKYLASAVFEAGIKILTPYLGESMVTEAFRELGGAAFGDGRTSTGVPVFVRGMDTTEQAINAFYLVVDPFVPGSATSIFGTLTPGSNTGLMNAYFEAPNRTTGKPKSLEAELVTNLTGARFSEFDPADSLMYKVKEYNRLKRETISSKPDYSMSPQNAYERQMNRQKAIYELQQDLYVNAMAAETLLGRGEVVKILRDNEMSFESINSLIAGKFLPEMYSRQKLFELLEKVDFKDKETKSDTINDIYRAYGAMIKTPLMPVTPEEIEEGFERPDEGREGFAKGGEVIVPNAPVEPDERIDKMTGLPYNIQAGSAFVDEEDPEKRMLFNLGGIVSKALGISEDDIAWAKSMSKKYPEAEELDGRGDAARHLALGWLAKQSNYPSFSKFAANAREFVEFDFKGGSMDIENNNKGFNMKAATREEAEEEIQKMIRNKEVLYYTPTESQEMRGY